MEHDYASLTKAKEVTFLGNEQFSSILGPISFSSFHYFEPAAKHLYLYGRKLCLFQC